MRKLWTPRDIARLRDAYGHYVKGSYDDIARGFAEEQVPWTREDRGNLQRVARALEDISHALAPVLARENDREREAQARRRKRLREDIEAVIRAEEEVHGPCPKHLRSRLSAEMYRSNYHGICRPDPRYHETGTLDAWGRTTNEGLCKYARVYMPTKSQKTKAAQQWNKWRRASAKRKSSGKGKVQG